MPLVPKQQVLQLYRRLLAGTRGLQLSNAEYVRMRLRREFERSRGVRDVAGQRALFEARWDTGG
ncbi:hypothetical protein HK105_200009 [Polyrhizophydium stewartii]|uniref:Complex 1 LYR protein domain-containing protein n=1 Tax=Polyrhizophydium stewartii TaxID=2732419 RepID=A0ABR4NK85_9FUNG